MKSKFATKVAVEWTFQGRSQSVKAWAAELGISESGLRARVRVGGYTIEEALSQSKLSDEIRSRMGNHAVRPVEKLTTHRQNLSNAECTRHLRLADSSGT